MTGLLKFATTYLGLTVVMAVLYLMVYGLIGAGLGISYLFWHDDFWVRSFSSTGATMLMAVVGVIAYYLDPHPWTTGRKTADFLEADEQIKHQVEAWYSKRPPADSPRPDVPQPAGLMLRWWDYLTFGLNAVLDPVSITPLQSWLEPDRENTQRLQRFLRAARGPFLLLLLAPALLPAAFSEVPHASPTGKIGLEWWTGVDVPPTYDVSRHFGGYLIGLASWLLGIQSGVLIIKIFIRASTLLHGTRLAEGTHRLMDRLSRSPRRRRGLAKVQEAYDRVGQVFGADAYQGPESPAGSERGCLNADSGTCPGVGCPRGEPTDGPSSPLECQAQGQLRVAALVFALLFLATFAVLGGIRHLRVTGVLSGSPLFGLPLPLFDIPPAFAICAMLAVVAMSYATIAYLPRSWQVPVVLVLVAWFGFANNRPFKNQFKGMGYAKEDIAPLRERVIDAYDTVPGKRVEDLKPNADPNLAPIHLVNDVVALEAWKARSVGGPDLDNKGRPKLVLVAVSGGATRSAYWTAVVLDQLERTLGSSFGDRVRIISGASGGMLGAACYVTYRRGIAEKKFIPRQGVPEAKPGLERASLLPTWVRKDLPTTSLEPLARGMALAEIWKSAWPGTVREDRGTILEQDWKVLQYPFAELAGLEGEGKIPSIIFSPMIVEDGRRLLISNLELGRGSNGWASSPIIESAGRQIHNDEFDPGYSGDGTERFRNSLSSLEYFRIFREKAHRDLSIATAVRMSASFPFVSPAVNLPTNPTRRVVDAGYFDNYGIQVATAWIRRNRDWLDTHTSGVLLVQIRDSSSVLDRLKVNTEPPSVLESVSRSFQFFTSPIDAVAKARETTASFRNDADVAALDSYNWDFKDESIKDESKNREKPARPESFFTTVIFENSAMVSLDPEDFWRELTDLDEGRPVKRDFREVSMSWYLARAEMAATASAIPDDPPRRKTGKSDWTDGQQRRHMMDRLNGDIAFLPPGPDQALRRKLLDQLYNYERLVNLKTWWGTKTR